MDAGVDEGQYCPCLSVKLSRILPPSLGVGATVYGQRTSWRALGKACMKSPLPAPGASHRPEEALLVVTACPARQGRARWTIELLAGEMVRLTEHDSVSREPCADAFN